MIDETGLNELLDGFRGGARYDRERLAEAALLVSAFAAHSQDWPVGLVINPLAFGMKVLQIQRPGEPRRRRAILGGIGEAHAP